MRHELFFLPPRLILPHLFFNCGQTLFKVEQLLAGALFIMPEVNGLAKGSDIGIDGVDQQLILGAVNFCQHFNGCAKAKAILGGLFVRTNPVAPISVKSIGSFGGGNPAAGR